MDSPNGLTMAFVLNGGRGQPIDWKSIRKWTPAQGLLWLHLDYGQEAARQWLHQESGLDAVSCESLVAEETRPRIIAAADSLFLILRGVNCNPGADPEDMVSLRMWIEEHRIITLSRRRVMAIEDLKQQIESGQGPRSAGDFLVMVAHKLVDRMGEVISDLDDAVDELEDRVLTEKSYELRPRLANLRRQTIQMRRYISPQRDVMARLQSERVSWFGPLDPIHIREVAERTARYVDDLDSARDRAAITQEELNSRLAEQMNKAMYIVSIATSIFLPLGLVTGLLGINVGGIPGSQNHYAFVFVCLALVLFAFIQFLFFKFKKWL
jgi:zinc transporter